MSIHHWVLLLNGSGRRKTINYSLLLPLIFQFYLLQKIEDAVLHLFCHDIDAEDDCKRKANKNGQRIRAPTYMIVFFASNSLVYFFFILF